MTKQNGLADQFYIDGYNLSGDIGSLSNIHGGPAALEVTGIDKKAFERIGGLRDGGIEFSSWFNDADGQAFPVLSVLPMVSSYAMYLRGQAIGSPGANLFGKQINYDPNRAADGALTLGSSLQGDGYGLEWGEQLTAGVRTDTAATDGDSFDFGASTTDGGQAYLQVFAVTGTSVTVKLQDSADDSTFADITGAAFTAATGLGAERIAFTGTVRRYVRAVTTGTFTNAEFAVVFVRNETAVAF
jgi:hypothetical protein